MPMISNIAATQAANLIDNHRASILCPFFYFPLRPQRARFIFLLVPVFPETQIHTPPMSRALPHSSQIPETPAPLPYSAHASKQSPLVRSPDASPLEFPSVSHRAWRAKRPVTSPQSPLAHFLIAQIAPLGKYFPHTPAWVSGFRRFRPFATRLRLRARKAHAPDWRWQSSRRAHTAGSSIPVWRHPPLRRLASKSQFFPPRMRIASPVRRVQLPPAFSDTQCPRKRTDRKELHSPFGRKNFRSTRKLRSLWCPFASQTFPIVPPSQTLNPRPPLCGFLFVALAPHAGRGKGK